MKPAFLSALITALFGLFTAACLGQVGGFRAIPVTDKDVITAAKAAIDAQAKKEKVALHKILKAEVQVVAGRNFRIAMDVRVDGGIRTAQATVWAKLDRSFQLTKWEWKGDVRPEEKAEPKPLPGSVQNLPKPQYRPARIEIIVYADFPKDAKYWDTLAEFLAAKGITAVEERMDKLDVCRKHGLKVRLGGTEAFPHLAKLKDDPAVLGYYLGDNSQPKHYVGFAQMLRKMEESDPNHPGLYIQTDDLGKLPNFVETVKPMTIDSHHYHWFHHGNMHFFYLKQTRDLAQKYGSSQMRCLSSNVTPVQLRQSMFCAVAYGVTDFHFWTPWLVGYKKEKDQPLLDGGKLVPTITAQGEAISATGLDLKWIGPVIVKLRHEAVYHTETILPGTEKAPQDYWLEAQGNSCLVSIFRDDRKNRYLMPVNHATDKPRELTLLFAADVAGLEKMDRKTGEWQGVRLDAQDKSRRAVLTLAPGDGEFLRVLPLQK